MEAGKLCLQRCQNTDSVFSAPRGGVTMMTPNLIQEYLYAFSYKEFTECKFFHNNDISLIYTDLNRILHIQCHLYAPVKASKR